MKSHRSARGSRRGGQGMTEYLIIVALIAVAAIAAFSYFGQTVRGQTASVSSELAGDTSGADEMRKAAQDAAAKAGDEARESRGLADYGEGNKGL